MKLFAPPPTFPQNKQGVSVRTVGRGGETPLHASAASGTPDAARLLLARGAHPLTKNAAGETPLDLARRFGSGSREGAEMVDLLEGAEALAVVEKTEVEAAEEKRLTAARGGKVAYEGNASSTRSGAYLYAAMSHGIGSVFHCNVSADVFAEAAKSLLCNRRLRTHHVSATFCTSSDLRVSRPPFVPARVQHTILASLLSAEGDEVFYVRDGDHHPATVMQVPRFLLFSSAFLAALVTPHWVPYVLWMVVA